MEVIMNMYMFIYIYISLCRYKIILFKLKVNQVSVDSIQCWWQSVVGSKQKKILQKKKKYRQIYLKFEDKKKTLSIIILSTAIHSNTL